MKRKFGIILFLCFLTLLLTSCDEVLSVVTVDRNGKKVVNNYVSTIISNTVYDETVSLKSWRDIFSEDESIDLDDLLFKIVNKKEKIVVLGNKEVAVEIYFFDGGYKYTVFSSMGSLSDF